MQVSAIPSLTLITTCSKKKLSTPFATIPNGKTFESQAELLEFWQKALNSCPVKRKVRAAELYRGRGFQRVSRLAAPENILILSAGLGLVKATDLLVPYNLTTSSGSPNHVKNHISGSFDPKLWWSDLTQETLLNTITDRAKEGLVLIALSRSYMEMISEDLLRLPNEVKERVRIFGTDLEEAIDFSWFDNIMPYDNRLNLVQSGFAGSKVDFSARALQHFVQHVLKNNPEGDAASHAKEVHTFISSLGSIEQASKETADDNRIREIVDIEWDTCFGRFTRILQTIRGKYQLACSENRLKRIMQEREDDQDLEVA